MSEEKKAGYDFIIRFPPIYSCKLDSDGNLSCKPVVEEFGVLSGEGG